AALTTGQPHQVESTGIRDDGTKYLVRLTAHPIVAPNGEPAGFVEVEEDITERKLSEGLAELVEDLQASLAATHDVTGAVRQALKVAFSLEGVDFGCAYVWDAATAGYRAVAQRGVSRRSALEDVAGAESKAIELIPIVHDGLTVGRLLIGSSTYYEFPPATHAALEALGTIVEGAVANLQALQLERETRSDVEALLLSLPVPVWCTDGEHRVTLWNRAAEQVFGWTAAEVVRSELPLQLLEAAPETDEVVCRAKDGTSLRLRTTTLRPPRALGARRRTMTMAVHVEPVDPPSGTASDGHSPPPTSNEAAPPIAAMPAKKRGRAGSAHPPRLLVVQESSFDRRILAATLRAQDCSVTMCRDGPTAVAKYESALGSSRRYSLVITELLASGCMGGLELASMLHRCDPHARVVLTSDSSIVGFESHGLAGALRRPYEPEAVRRMLVELLDTC
ncbi:MAG TPA: PAS domain-containing protein, partial [Thermoleophilia bacterium]|nr:PAS domain-containing protein [Thermoleophilia bacterium]